MSTFPDNLFGNQSMSLYTENLPTTYSLVVSAVARVSGDLLCSVVILLRKLSSLPGFVVILRVALGLYLHLSVMLL